MKTGVKVMDAMTRGLIKVKPESTAADCAKIMLKKSVGGVLVQETGLLIGIVTEKDLVEKVVARNINPKKVKVRDIMTKRLITISPDEDIYEALIKMRKEEVRRLPVIYRSKPVGILTEKDILKIEPSLFDVIVEKMKLREESGKPLSRRLTKGKCESCGSQSRLYSSEGRLVCDVCREL